MSELKERIKNSINKYLWIVIFLLMAPFYNDSYGSFNIISEWNMDCLKVLVFGIFVLILLIRRKKVSTLFIMLSIMETWWMITTIINYGTTYSDEIHKTLIDIVNALSVSLVIECFKDKPKDLLKGLMLNLELAIYPNLVSVILDYPGNHHFLLGTYSALILWILPAICVSLLYLILFNKRSLRAYALLISSLVTVVLIWCATILVAMIGMAAVILSGIILMKMKKTKEYKIPLSILIIIAILGNAFILFVYTNGSFPLVDLFIEKILRRSTTFTGRTLIWAEAMRMIMEKPIIGHGFRPEIIVSNDYGTSFIHSHNQLLQRLNATGIIGLILFIMFHIELVRKVDTSKNTFARLVMVGAVFAICITYITDAYKKFFRFYLVFFLAYHIDTLLNERFNNEDYLLK